MSSPRSVDGELAQEQVFAYPFDEVWLAAQIVLSKYPIQVNNMDIGIMETRYIKGEDGWTPAHTNKRYPGGRRYKISIRLVKGDIDNKEATKVIVGKSVILKRDFFSDEETIPSDGLEEQAILYRIKRELVVAKAIKKLNESQRQKL